MNQDHKKLHEKFSTLGRERNRLTYELLAMLPQIYDEEIYRKYRCATIYEYAGKYAGLSHSVVEKTLKLHKELEGKPFLREAIKIEGVHKVALVAKIATAETDEVLAQRVVDMSRPALIELSKELRRKVELNQATILCHAAQESMTIALDPEMQFMFLKLKKEFEKKKGVNLSNKLALRAMLEELESADVAHGTETGEPVSAMTGDSARPQKMCAVKNFPGKKLDKNEQLLCGDIESKGVTGCVNRVRERVKKIDSGLFKRYIPVAIRKIVLNTTRGGCAYPGCNRPYENFHHRERFANGGRHDSIVPVCGAHHEFAHNGLVRRELADAKEWELDLIGGGSFVDKRSIEYRMEARNGG